MLADGRAAAAARRCGPSAPSSRSAHATGRRRDARGPRGAVAIYFVPVVAIALGVVLLGERITPLAIAGTALVLVGAWFTSRRER